MTSSNDTNGSGRLEPVDVLIRAGHVVTMNPRRDIIRRGAVDVVVRTPSAVCAPAGAAASSEPTSTTASTPNVMRCIEIVTAAPPGSRNR